MARALKEMIIAAYEGDLGGSKNVIVVDPGPREPPPLRPRDLRRAVRNEEIVG